MCNLYKMTRTVDEVARLFRAVADPPGNAGDTVYPGYRGTVACIARASRCDGGADVGGLGAEVRGMEEDDSRGDWGTWLIVRIMPGGILAGLASLAVHRVGATSLGAMFGFGWLLATVWNGWIDRARGQG